MKVFGLLIDWISSHYHQAIWTGIQEVCRQRGVNLVTLVSGRPGSPFQWEQMRNQLLEFVDGKKFDGFLFMTATLGNHLDGDQFRQLLTRVSPAPVVSIGAALEGVPTVLVDNRGGFQTILQHLYEVHGYRRFAFAGGTVLNLDARERRAMFVNFLRDHDLELRQDWILDGEFSTTSGREAVNRLLPEPGLKPDFEVLVCASDDIAMGVIEGLAERNLHVPGDVAVTGFDDVVSSSQAALTTARQNLGDLGRRAAELLWEEVDLGRSARYVRIETTLVVRQSCGCLSPAAQESSVSPQAKTDQKFSETAKAERGQLLAELTGDGFPPHQAAFLVDRFLEAWEAQDGRIFHHGLQRLLASMVQEALLPGLLHHPLSVLRRWVLQSNEPADRRAFLETLVHRGRILLSETVHTQAIQKETHQSLIKDRLSELNERLVYSKTFADQASILLDLFPGLGINHFRLALYDDVDHPMDLARLVLTEKGEVPDGGLVYNPREIFAPGYEPASEPWSFVAEALFDRAAPLGFFLLDANGDSSLLSVFDQLCERVGRGVETVRRIQDLEEQVADRTEELRDALEDLEAYNVQLKQLALRDELTGLYNRRGFLALAEHQLKAHYRKGPGLVLFFGDLDGLKLINDTWGHEAGDQAIRITAKLLVETFRAEDLVARLAGDEFVVLAPGCTPEDADSLARRLDEAFAGTEDGRYGISLGWIAIDPRARRPLGEWMKEADEALYRKKLVKKSRRP